MTLQLPSTCSLCGHRFDAEKQGCSPTCPLGGCGLVCCPNCGHGAPKEGPIAAGLRRLLVKLQGGGRRGGRETA
jgi:hypothetical protein